MLHQYLLVWHLQSGEKPHCSVKIYFFSFLGHKELNKSIITGAQTLLVEQLFVILLGNYEVGATTGAQMAYQVILKPSHWRYLCFRDAPVVQLFVEHTSYHLNW